jgi:hypothetical protein
VAVAGVVDWVRQTVVERSGREFPHPSFPSVCTQSRVVSILKPGKDSAMPSSYRPISLLDSIGKIFEKIFLARISHDDKRARYVEG